jgi:hypothetical protein
MVLNGITTLLGIAGSISASAVSGWIAPVLLGLSILLIGRSFYVIYVRGVRTRATVVIAWIALFIIVGYWTYHLTIGRA